jgi:L-histidine Nalpha-methyltransferase
MTIADRTPIAQARARFRTYAEEQQSFAAALRAGLRQPRKSIPCRFLYDRIGSELFDQICELPEYYITRAETAILAQNAEAIAALVGPRACMIELGAGSGVKTRILLDALPDLACYAPIDVSREHLRATVEQLARDYPRLRIEGICADYNDAIPLPSHGERDIVFFPGSTVGNLSRREALALLSAWRERVGPDGLMIIGIDLKKDIQILKAAYDDAAGITETFIRNILARANRELGADFDQRGFSYEARYREDLGRVEMHLRSIRDQTVRVGDERFRFSAGERIHIENSHKYSVDAASELGQAAGFRPIKCFTDDNRLFSVHVWAA